MSIKMMMEIERAHARIDQLEKKEVALIESIAKLEGELKAMKARMGKRELSEV